MSGADDITKTKQGKLGASFMGFTVIQMQPISLPPGYTYRARHSGGYYWHYYLGARYLTLKRPGF